MHHEHQQQLTNASDTPPSWEALLWKLEFNVADIHHEEALQQRSETLERAREAYRLGWSVEVWSTLETLRAQVAWEQRIAQQGMEHAIDMELERFEHSAQLEVPE